MPRRRLDAWKEIAAYLKRDVTTVRRWEKREGLPVHRHLHDKLGSVYAYTDEIDEWSVRRASTPAGENGGGEPAAPAPSPRRWRIVASAGVLAAAVLVMVMLPRPTHVSSPPGPPMDFAISPPVRVIVASLALAPAGDHVVFSGYRAGEPSRLWIRRLDSISVIELAGTDGASLPFWSPDGGRVGFFAQEKLKTIALGTREIRELASAPHPRGGSWSEHDVILFAPDDDGPICRVGAPGGAVTAVTAVEELSEGHAWPDFLPGGQRFLYFDQRVRGHGIYVGDLDAGPIRRLVEVYSSGMYTPEGYLLYARDHLLAQRFDPGTLELIGEPVIVADRVLSHYGWHHKMDVSTSRTGLLAVRRGDDGLTRLTWVNRAGRELGSVADAVEYSNPTISPDGTQAAITAYESPSHRQGNLFLLDLTTLQSTRVTFGPHMDVAPVWSPDGDRLFFLSNRRGPMELYERSLTGGAESTLLPVPRKEALGRATLPWMIPESWASDHTYLTYSVGQVETKSDVWMLDLRNGLSPRPLLNGSANEAHSQISPDGRYIAYASDESGRFEIYVQSFPVLGQKWQVSSAGGADPRWKRDGRELYYVAADRRMMAVQIDPGPSRRYGAPRPLFQTDLKYLWQDTRNHYDVTPDGQRFLILAPRVDPRSAAYTMILNWSGALPSHRPTRAGGR
jgi:Tol biopolymer transport system component